MPQYEYLCETDGSRLTLLRPMREADAPVEDPEGKGRVFARVMSVPMLAASERSSGDTAPRTGGGCGCGRGGCGGH